jgi:FtsP/CotA-like multicopper oxidase with cupredoxin domain
MGTAALAVTAYGPSRGQTAAARPTAAHLVAGLARAAIAGGTHPETEVWSYNGTAPGPILRFRQGERVQIAVDNRLPQGTTVHWHGVRVPNAMDGVPDLTQPPIAPGASFTYEFDVPDAGTFWYHPHTRSPEQVERGLAGAFIVEEQTPPEVDRDIVWVLDDWRLTPEAAVAGEFGNLMDASHAGRFGNTVTINGRVPESFAVKAGERLRLRLINAANARIFGLEFRGLTPTIVALDGQPVEPHAPEGGRVVLGPAMRADLILDCGGAPGERIAIVDTFYRQRVYTLVELVYDGRMRERPPAAAIRLPDNPVAVPDLTMAERHTIELGGGMMDPKLMRLARERGGQLDPETIRGVRERMQSGHIWTINGQSVAGGAVTGHAHAPLLSLRLGRPYVFAMHNDTAWHHPMHLHGLVVRVLSRNGRANPRVEWRDTVLMDPGEKVEIAFTADNPGDWMFHCHILEHQEAGMMGTIRVA